MKMRKKNDIRFFTTFVYSYLLFVFPEHVSDKAMFGKGSISKLLQVKQVFKSLHTNQQLLDKFFSHCLEVDMSYHITT